MLEQFYVAPRVLGFDPGEEVSDSHAVNAGGVVSADEAAAVLVDDVNVGVAIWVDLGAAVGDQLQTEWGSLGELFEYGSDFLGVEAALDEDVGSDDLAGGGTDSDRVAQCGRDMNRAGSTHGVSINTGAEVGDDRLGVVGGGNASAVADDVASELSLLQCGENGMFDSFGSIEFTEILKHHDRRQDYGGWVDYVLPRIFGG